MTKRPKSSRRPTTSDSRSRESQPKPLRCPSNPLFSGSTSISTHPRNIDSLVRRPDDARKSKRQAKAERKAAERAVQEEETRKQKGKKRREMERQLEQLKAELGDSVDWKALEKVVDGEWDEEEWERVIGGMLSGAADAVSGYGA